MKTVILAGGMGTRIREETEFKPKPMVEIGGLPIIWHIMKSYSSFGYKDFVICTGYKGEQIKEFFKEYETLQSDFTINFARSRELKIYPEASKLDWSVTISNTGISTPTGGRILKVKKYLENETFLCTYGDGLSDINIKSLIDFHKSHGKIATISCIRPPSRFGRLEIDSNFEVKFFKEKPIISDWVNGGFFVFESSIFQYLSEGEPLEDYTLPRLIDDSQLMAFCHEGYWQSMDTYREMLLLNKIWDSGQAPWKIW
jgi:glucose-1-phosphate cytidylyltransferase